MSNLKMRERTLNEFIKQGGKCCYCKCKCVFILNSAEANKIHNSKGRPDNLATLEHIYPKTDIRRWVNHNGAQTVKMACVKCNSERGISTKHITNFDYSCIDKNLFKDLLNGFYDGKIII